MAATESPRGARALIVWVVLERKKGRESGKLFDVTYRIAVNGLILFNIQLSETSIKGR
jgi:hypothetical protein